MSCHSLLAWRVSVERSAVTLMRICLWVIFFPFLLLIFVLCVWSLLIWLICVLGVSPWVYPVWNSLGFLDLGGYFLPHFREVFNYYLLKYFLMAFLFVFFFWDSCDSNVGAFHTVPEVSEVVLISSDSFFFFPPCFIYSHQSVFHLTYPVFCFSYSLSVPSRVLLISVIALFIIDWLFYFFYVLVKFFLHLLNPCPQTICVHFVFKILGHFYYHCSEYFFR